ncbi:MAG: hypothetical protein IIY21_19180 [Clostridiales bacterium]|nr:hypothetical protein [Clostridiales bacterium]MBQ1570349.1 hypothetical protein [Clostridiales bacterium]
MTNEEKMTPEEAIAEISFLKVAVNKVMEQALDMAIQALSQEPICDRDCEHCTWTERPIESCDDVEQIDYHDDFETALKKMQDYEERQTEKNCDTCINKDKCSPNIREIVRKNGCPKWTPNKDMYEPLLPMGKYLKTSFPCDAEEDVKQTKQEPCDELVSREAVIEAVSEGCQEWRGIYGRCEELINALPSVTQKSGKWIGKDFRKEEYVLTGKCSVCGQVRVIDKFCSHCGARMESEE